MITAAVRKPRNPLVRHAQFRRAGSHRPAGHSLRQADARTLRRELDQFKRPHPSP
ncbi:MAG: hypothetical protein M3O01_01270 [Pseudomonadota bacterium]|nr:hypothetical protein [Pseudomonadota bacterium]